MRIFPIISTSQEIFFTDDRVKWYRLARLLNNFWLFLTICLEGLDMNLHKAKILEAKGVAASLFLHLHGAIAFEGFGDGQTSETTQMSGYLLQHIRVSHRRGKIKVALPEPGPLPPDEEMSEDVKVVCEMLHTHISGRHFTQSQLSRLTEILNLRVSGLGIYDAKTQRIVRNAPAARLAAEELLRYLGYFWDDPSLLEHKAIGICPECQRLILINHKKRKWCSQQCCARDFAKRKMKENPGYFHSEKSRQIQRAAGRGGKLEGTS
ncbi:MAG: hypothetical protein ABSH28_09025 [Acidobacteriota bacterium]